MQKDVAAFYFVKKKFMSRMCNMTDKNKTWLNTSAKYLKTNFSYSTMRLSCTNRNLSNIYVLVVNNGDEKEKKRPCQSKYFMDV